MTNNTALGKPFSVRMLWLNGIPGLSVNGTGVEGPDAVLGREVLSPTPLSVSPTKPLIGRGSSMWRILIWTGSDRYRTHWPFLRDKKNRLLPTYHSSAYLGRRKAMQDIFETRQKETQARGKTTCLILGYYFPAELRLRIHCGLSWPA